MAKIIEYPKDAFSKALELAEAVDYLGGSCSVETCAERLGRSPTSGGFVTLLASTSKFDLIDSKKSNLAVTELYKSIKLAYSSEEKVSNQIKAFLSPPTFRKIYDKFKGKELPVRLLGTILIREFGVDRNSAGRISAFFTEGVKSFNLLIEDRLIDLDNPNRSTAHQNSDEGSNKVNAIAQYSEVYIPKVLGKEEYTVHILGPGIDTKINISEEEDLEIVSAVLNKLKRKLSL